MHSARSGAAESITQVLVRTVTGLERLAAEELAAAGHRVIDVSKRQIVVEATTAAIITGSPRLADDLFVVRAAVTDPGPTKQALAAAVRGLVVPGARGPFAVSASFQGRRNFNRFDVEDLIGGRIEGGTYHSRRTGAVPPAERVDWRVVLDGTTLWVAVRPFEVPLHRRVWRRRTVAGSLHPPVAAAMAGLAGIRAGQRVLDPFCGAGTLLLEAHAIEPGATYLGIDRQPAALAAARANTPSREVTWRTGDAARLSGPVDRILTNPPWNVRVSLGDFAPYLREWRRVLRPGGRVVAILNQEQAARISADAAWRVVEAYDVAVAGRHPRIVVAERSAHTYDPGPATAVAGPR